MLQVSLWCGGWCSLLLEHSEKPQEMHLLTVHRGDGTFTHQPASLPVEVAPWVLTPLRLDCESVSPLAASEKEFRVL